MEDIPWEDENRADLITTDEALELLAYYDIPEETMQEWVKSGTLEQVLTSDGAVRYRRKDILALQQHYFPAGGEPVPVPSALIDLRSAVLRTLVVPGAVHIEVTGDDSVHLYLGESVLVVRERELGKTGVDLLYRIGQAFIEAAALARDPDRLKSWKSNKQLLHLLTKEATRKGPTQEGG